MFRGRTASLRIGRARMRVEVADSILTRAVGVMFRRSLPAGRGVVLVFPRSARHWLHMWWVRFPLDLAGIGDHGRVTEVRSARPGQGPFRLRRPVRRVLEVPAGWCRRHGVGPGARVGPSAGVR